MYILPSMTTELTEPWAETYGRTAKTVVRAAKKVDFIADILDRGRLTR